MPSSPTCAPQEYNRVADYTQARQVISTGGSLYQLLVSPIVKSTVGQRDMSGQALGDFVASGSSFRDVITTLWERYRPRMELKAVRFNDSWSSEVPSIERWSKMMQLKLNKHLVDTNKTEHAWNAWLVKNRGKTVQLLIYDYGTAIATNPQLEAFLSACIRPQQVDRAGATAEASFMEVVSRLQTHWCRTFQAEAVIWRMWGNHITRNLDRSTGDALIEQPPPVYIANLLRPANTRLEEQLTGITRSAQLALDCVKALIADYHHLREDWKAFGRRLDGYEQNLETRRAVIEAFIRDALPPAREDVLDPLLLIQNVEDHEHAE